MSAEIRLEPGCRAVATTQACEKIYRASAGTAEIRTTLTLGAGARLDWLPQETILFDGARLSRRLDADLATDAPSFFVVEAVIFGRAAHGETVRSGVFRRPLAHPPRRPASSSPTICASIGRMPIS